MANLFQSNLTEQDLSQILSSSLPRNILPAAGSDIWKAVAHNPLVRQWMEPLREKAAEEVDAPLPELTDRLYHEFHKSGARINFESIYYERRRRLGRAAICALLEPEEPRWLKSTLAKTQEILDEFSWALPAHVNTHSGKDPMHIDVAASETANLMAQLFDLFGASLGNELIAKIKWRLRSQFFENYVNRHDDFFWMLSSGHWNAMCHQGVVGPALTFEVDTHLVSRMLMFMKRYLPVYLGGFGGDGGCNEGPVYWQSGFLWFCALNEQLEIRTNGRLSLIEGEVKISEIARYGIRTSLRNFHFVNFADSFQSGVINPALLSYLADRLQDDHMRLHAQLHYSYLRDHGLPLNSQRCDFFYLVHLFLRCPDSLPEKVSVNYEDVHFKDIGVVVAHGRDESGNEWDFAAKAGHNNEQHNHNDCGSFIVNINGTPLITEIGAPEYTKDYFREHRYDYLAARTFGHSLPVVNGCEQSPGERYASKVLAVEMDEHSVHFCVDLTGCYPTDADCGEVVRDFQWDKARGRIQVKDYYELYKKDSFETAIITDRDVRMADGEAIITGETASLIIRPLPNTVIASIDDQEYRDHHGVPKKVRRIVLKPDEFKDQQSVGCEIIIAG